MGGDVLDVGKIFQSSLDLERANAGVDQGAQVSGLVVVLEREQVFVVSEKGPPLISQ